MMESQSAMQPATVSSFYFFRRARGSYRSSTSVLEFSHIGLFACPDIYNHEECKNHSARALHNVAVGTTERERKRDSERERQRSQMLRLEVLLTFAAIAPQISGQTLLTLGPCSALLTYTKSCAITAITDWAKGITITLCKNKTHKYTHKAGNRLVLGFSQHGPQSSNSMF